MANDENKFSGFPVATGPMNGTSKTAGIHNGANVRFTGAQLLEMAGAGGGGVGAANGVAALDANGKVPVDQLPEGSGGGSGGDSPYPFNVKNFGALGNGTANDTVAIQNAINACIAAGGGIVYFPNGVYVVSGNLITTKDGVAVNCQICFPSVVSSTTMPRIELLGESAPNWASEVVDGSGRNTKGVIIKSNIVGGGTRPSVFGSAYYSAGYGSFSFLYVDFKNIVIQTRTKTTGEEITPTMSGVDAYHLSALTFYRSCVQTESIPPDLLTPTGTYGLILPAANNKAVVNVDQCKIEGFDVGLQMSEHVVCHDLIIDGCINAIELLSAPHGCSITHCKLEGNKNNILVNGNADLVITAYDSEHYLGSEFYSFEKDVKFVSGINNSISIVKATVVKSFVGKVNEFVNDPGAKVRILFGAGANSLPPDPEPEDPNILLEKTWNDLNGWTVNSPGGGAVIDVQLQGGDAKLHMVRGSAVFNNITKTIVYEPGDQLKVETKGVVYASSGNVQVLLSDGDNPWGIHDVAPGDSEHIIDTTGFPAGALAFYINNTQGEVYMRYVKVTKIIP